MLTFEEVYDQRYLGGYREQLSGYEIARWNALDHFITNVLAINDAKRILDYGAGAGLHAGLWKKLFSEASLHFCDISSVAKENFRRKYPSHADSYCLVREGHAGIDDSSFDVVVSVEVMEHVEDLAKYLKDIHRLLKPGGMFIWTTPCANRLSIEHIFSFLTGMIEGTNEGYRRWKWEDTAHLRRLRSQEIAKVMKYHGFDSIQFRFRAHLFSFLCTYCPPRRKYQNLREKLMMLDYRLFRRLPNGASMLGAATAVK